MGSDSDTDTDSDSDSDSAVLSPQCVPIPGDSRRGAARRARRGEWGCDHCVCLLLSRVVWCSALERCVQAQNRELETFLSARDSASAAASTSGSAPPPPPPPVHLQQRQQQIVERLRALQLFETNDLRVLHALLSDFKRLPSKSASRAFKLSDALLHIDSDIDSFSNLKLQLGTPTAHVHD